MKVLKTLFLIVSTLITTPAALLLALVGCYFLWVGIAGLLMFLTVENITNHSKLLTEKTSQAVKSSKNLLIEKFTTYPRKVFASHVNHHTSAKRGLGEI